MSDAYNFSWSVDIATAETPSDKAGRSIAFADCAAYPLPDSHLLLVHRRTGARTVVTADVHYALSFCNTFRTRTVHIDTLTQKIPQLQNNRGEVDGVIDNLDRMGFIEHADALLADLWNSDPEPTPAPRPRIAVCTCDRPEALQRLLGSIADKRNPDQPLEGWVIDDSRNPDHQRRNRDLVEGAGLAGLRYCGPEQQAALQQRLSEALPQAQQEIAFLIGPRTADNVVTHGRTRNLALLLAAGQPLVFLDDDVRFEILSPPERDADCEFSSRPREVVFFDQPDAWEAYAVDLDQDLLDLHGAFLGQGLGPALRRIGRQPPAPETLSHLFAAEGRALTPASRLLVTGNGSMGDPGVANNRWLFELTGASLQRLIADEPRYRRNLTQRNLWLGRERHHFFTRFSLLSQVTGLDNRELLPPYFPVFRNEDFLFGEMLRLMHPEALMLDLPWAVPHLPLEERRWSTEKLDQPDNPGVCGFIAGQLATGPDDPGQDTPADRVREAGHRLLGLAAGSDDQLAARIRHQILATRAERARFWDQHRKEHLELPAYYQRDLQRMMQRNLESLLEPQPSGLSDSRAAFGAEAELPRLRELFQGFGQALLCWPQIIQAAKAIESARL